MNKKRGNKKLFKRRFKFFETKLTTLEKYKILFTTIDGEEHESNRINYIDPNTISCSVGDYYLIGEKYLEYDEGYIYPIENIQKIKFVLVSTLENVVEKWDTGWRYVWYPEDIIEIYNNES